MTYTDGMDHDWKQISSKVAVSAQLLTDCYLPTRVGKAFLWGVQSTPEERAEREARRRAEWDEKRAAGLVPVEEFHPDDGVGFRMLEEFEPWHDVLWVEPAMWQNYLYVSHLLDVLEDEIRGKA